MRVEPAPLRRAEEWHVLEFAHAVPHVDQLAKHHDLHELDQREHRDVSHRNDHAQGDEQRRAEEEPLHDLGALVVALAVPLGTATRLRLGGVRGVASVRVGALALDARRARRLRGGWLAA